jgi:hypothetical protein
MKKLEKRVNKERAVFDMHLMNSQKKSETDHSLKGDSLVF